jgi:ABC-2 type transport system ATP-binding protein
MNSNKYVIQIKSISKKFGDFYALKDINLNITQGSIFALLGPNGSGKTTLVKIMSGLLIQNSGECRILNSITRDSMDFKNKIGVLPNEIALFDMLTIWEHTTLVGRVHGLSYDEIEKRSRILLNFFDLWDDRYKYTKDLSYGMSKKLSFILAILINPKLLILDEPFEGLDPFYIKKVKNLLLDFSKKGITIFITSHILDLIDKFITDFAIIKKGEIVCVNTIENLIKSSQSLEDVFFQYYDGSLINESFE